MAQPLHSVSSTTVADLLERILDKGIVIVGDIKISLVQVELLSIHIQLLICSVDKAQEIGVDWWSPQAQQLQKTEALAISDTLIRLEQRLTNIESKIESGAK